VRSSRSSASLGRCWKATAISALQSLTAANPALSAIANYPAAFTLGETLEQARADLSRQGAHLAPWHMPE